jgi:hypothetical protein
MFILPNMNELSLYVLAQPCRFIEIQNQLQWFAVIFASDGCTVIVMASGLSLIKLS